MADKKKMSVEEILAACRNPAGQDSSDAPPASASESAPSPGDAPAAADPESPKKAAASAGAGKKPGEMSVDDILAAARAGKSGPAGAPAPDQGASAKPAKAKPAKAKPAAKKAMPKDAAKPDSSAGALPKDTSSILAAARKGVKPGPVSKSALAQSSPEKETKAKPKPALVVPPMPEKPQSARPQVKVTATVEKRRTFLAVLLGSWLAVGFTMLGTVFAFWTAGLARFMFPNILTEPPSRFKVGFPANFPAGMVETKFKAQFGVWVVNTEYDGQPQIFALKSVCTHLGCTPNWLDAEQKFKCPCHGSGFYIDGVNFEGPAPRPLERYAIQVADDGQLEVDKSKTFQEELGQWRDTASFVPV